MQPVIKYYQPGKIITLIDLNKNSSFAGSLVFQTRNVNESNNYKIFKSFKKVNKLFLKINKQFLVWDKKISQKVKQIELPKLNRFYPTIALVLLLFSFISLTMVLLPLFAAGFGGASKNETTTKVVEKKWSGESLAQFDGREQRDREKLLIKDFKITIPKINIESDIIAYVDSTNEVEYKEQLKSGVAHAKGSYLPYESGPMYLFSHSTDSIFNIVQYNAKFYALRELEESDELTITLNGKEYKYKVKSKEIINPEQIELIHQTKADLIMQTCWPPGTDWQRLIVYAEKVK